MQWDYRLERAIRSIRPRNGFEWGRYAPHGSFSVFPIFKVS